MTNASGPESYAGKTAVDTSGDKIGSVGQVYVNDESGVADWITVNTGLFGTKEHFAPLHGSSLDGDNVVLSFDKDVVKNSPDVADSDHLDADESEALYTYYQQYLGQGASTQSTESHYAADDVDRRTAVADQGDTDGFMTRSEEQLHVGTQRVEAGRAGLRKFVVTEQQTVTVPVSHDEVKIIREPLQPGETVDGATIGEDSIEVALMEDKVVVNKEVVGVEKIRLATETVTEQEQVTEAVRKEQIETTGVTTTGELSADAVQK